MPAVSHQVLEVPHCISQMRGTTFWIHQLKSRFQGPQFFLGNATLPGTDLRLAAEKYQSPTLSATFGSTSNPTLLATPFPTRRNGFVGASTNLLEEFGFISTISFKGLPPHRISERLDMVYLLRSIRRCHSYPHPQSWGWSPAQRAPTGWRSKRVEPLPSRSTAARSIVPRGIGRSVYETWQEFVSRRNDCSRWNRTFKSTSFVHVPGERPICF